MIKDESASELDRMNFKYVLNQRFSEKYMHADTLQPCNDLSYATRGWNAGSSCPPLRATTRARRSSQILWWVIPPVAAAASAPR